MELRACVTSDFGSVADLLQQLWPQKPLNRGSLRDVFERGLESDAQRYLCAVEDGRVVGFCSMTLESNLWVEGNLAHVDELVVDSAYRGRGIGSRLLDAMIDLARARGAKRVELDSALHRKDAHHFYERSGFETRAFVFSKSLE